MILRKILTKNLSKNNIKLINLLKNTHWKYGTKSHISWFNKHIKSNDIHNLAYLKEKLVGYVLLRNRNFLIKEKIKNYLYLDTLIVSKKHRKLNIGHTLSSLAEKVIKKSKLHSMLICEKKLEPFYKENKWKKKIKKIVK